ncbi:MAG: hypothetical protein ACOC2U_00760 [bacterium]
MKKAINCKTKEEFEKILGIYEEKGWLWLDGEFPTHSIDKWDTYSEKTCIDYSDDFGYADTNYYLSNDFQIISFEEFLQLEGKTSKSKTRSFPRLMLVSDDISKPIIEWEKVEVIGYLGESVIYPYITYGVSGGEYFGYKYAVEIDEKEQEAIKLLESKGYKITK